MRIVSHTTLVTGNPGEEEHVPPGKPIDVEDKEAQRLISRGLAVKFQRTAAREPQGSKPQPEKEVPPPPDPAEGSDAE